MNHAYGAMAAKGAWCTLVAHGGLAGATPWTADSASHGLRPSPRSISQVHGTLGAPSGAGEQRLPLLLIAAASQVANMQQCSKVTPRVT
jgi:hypothetical protein